jgi:hypothetical protein
VVPDIDLFSPIKGYTLSWGYKHLYNPTEIE